MQLPREVIVGVNILDRVGEICTKQGFHGTALVVSGPVTYPIAGVGVAKSATKAGLRVEQIIVKESTEASLNQIVEMIKNQLPQATMESPAPMLPSRVVLSRTRSGRRPRLLSLAILV